MRKLPYQSSLQFIQRPQLLWNDTGDRKLWRGIQWIRRGPTVPSRLSWNAYQSNIPKPRSGVRWKHGMRKFSEYGNVASRITYITYLTYIHTITLHHTTLHHITSHYITLHHITSHHITLHTIHYITSHHITLHTLHTLHYITDRQTTYITYIHACIHA